MQFIVGQIKNLQILQLIQAFDPQNAILVEQSLGNPSEWAIPFDKLARKKAYQAWRNGCANVDIQTKHPSALQDDDILFYGSFLLAIKIAIKYLFSKFKAMS